MQNDPNEFFRGDAPELSYSRDYHAPSLLNGQTLGPVPYTENHYNLGLDLRFTTGSFEPLSSYPGNDHHVAVKPPSLGQMGGVGKVVLKEEGFKLPSVATNTLTLFSAARIGKRIADESGLAEAAGIPKTEAVVCSSLKVMTEEIAKKVGDRLILAGIPVYAAAAVENPALLLGVPVLAQKIPEAFQGASVASQLAGNAVDDACHKTFRFSRK